MLGVQINSMVHSPGKDLWTYEKRNVCSFDGTDDYCVSDFFDDIEGSSSWTISFWINIASIPPLTALCFHHGDAIYSNPPFFQVGFNSSGGVRYFKISNWHGTGADVLSEGDHSLDFDESKDHDRWIHVFFRWDKDIDSGKIQYMLDACGTITSSSQADTNVVPAMGGSEAQQRLAIGGYYVSGLGSLAGIEGKMADVAIWRSRLGDQEAYMLASGVSPLDIEATTLNHFWKLSGSGEDDGSATTRDEADLTAVNDADIGAAL